MSKKSFDFNLLIGPLGIVFLVLFYLVFGLEATVLFTIPSGILIWFINWKTDRDLDQYKREARKEGIKSFKRNQAEEKRRIEEAREEARLREIWKKFREEEKNSERENKRRKKKK